METPGASCYKKIQVTCFSVLGVLGEVTQRFGGTLFCLHSLRSNHFPSHRTRPVFSNPEVRLTLKYQIPIAKYFDLPQTLVFNFFVDHVYIAWIWTLLYSHALGVWRNLCWLWRSVISLEGIGKSFHFVLSFVFMSSQFFMKDHSPFWPMIKSLLRKSLCVSFWNYTNYFVPTTPLMPSLTDPIGIK